MRIACTLGTCYPEETGGLERYAHGLTKTLVELGDEVDLFAVMAAAARPTGSVRTFRIADPAAPLPFKLASAGRTYAKHFPGRYDVVNAHLAVYAVPLLPYLRHGPPLVVNFQGPWAAEGKVDGDPALTTWIKAWLERLVYRRAVRFIVLGNAFAKLLVDSYGVDSSLVRIIPIGIDTEFFKPPADRAAVRTRLGWAPHQFAVFTARRLIRRVGLVELVAAAARVRLAGTDMQVYIAGRGPMEAELRARIAELCAADYIHLVGFVSDDDLRDFYAAADFTILPSQALEGFGTSIAESLACGTPVGVTPVGGMPDAVSELDPALVAPSSTAEGIAALLLAAAGGRFAALDPLVCRTYAVDRFAWRSIGLAVRDVFAEVLPSG